MDYFVNHWGAFSRRFPSPFTIQTIGYIPRKTDWVHHTFGSCNFSFVARGTGEYRRGGRLWKVEAPYVITQWPGEALEYGPSENPGWWEELYLVYRTDHMEPFSACGFIRPERPAWKIERPAAWQAVYAELLELTRRPEERQADRIDRLCERLIFESLLPEETARRSSSPSQPGRQVDHLRGQIARAPHQPLDWEGAARRMGMSAQTLRRHWMREVGTPPARYASELRMKEACRRLVESDLTIGEIAAQLGYEDALYFSRKFRGRFAVSASAYRKMNRR